jgi:hypothetical protein
MMKTYVLKFVPHLAVEFEVEALDPVTAQREAERQIRDGTGPVFEQIRVGLFEMLLVALVDAKGRPSLGGPVCAGPSLSNAVERTT